MTTVALLRVIARRWYVFVIGAAVIGVVFVTLLQGGGAYSTTTKVLFVAPNTQTVAVFDTGQGDTLTSFAAVIERQYHDGRTSDRLAENASLFGSGVDQGSLVLLPKEGGQWSSNFPEPALSIDVVGPSAEWVWDTEAAIIDKIERLAREEQLDAGVPLDQMITTQPVAVRTPVDYIGSSRSTQLRALLALTVVGGGLSIFLAIRLDRLASHRRNRPRSVDAAPKKGFIL